MSAYQREPWDNIRRQRQAALFGMWAFLGSEILLFAGLFAGYAVYRGLYPEGFLAGARETDIVYGTANTAIMMTSSLALATAGRAAEAGMSLLSRRLIIVTILLGTAFLVVKGFEYGDDIARHLVPGPQFPIAERGAALFFSFYWIMTGIHAVHVTGGLVALLRLVMASRRDPAWLSGSAAEEATALYWHLVDAIWVVLFPLLYLSGRTHG